MEFSAGAQTLVNVVQSLSSARSIDEIMRLVRSAAREIAEADGATFVLKDHEFCFYADEDAIMPLWKGQRFPLTACVSGWAMNHKEAVIIEDIYQDPRVPIDAYRPTFVKSLAMTPIRLDDPIGAIGTYWSEKHTPTEEQRQMLQALANTASVAIENVNLYRSLEERIEELNKANHAKTEFLTTLSHELRTPLNSIVGWSEMLKDSDIDEEDKSRGVETIYRNAVNQTHTIDNLLDISQMVSGKFNMNHRPSSLPLAVSEAISQVQDETVSKGLQILFDNRTSFAQVLGDGVRLRQMVYNLLKNAIKFSSAGQTIQVSIERAGPNYLVKVKDQGVGISESAMPYIFEIFKQADNSLLRKHGGLGLGLSIVQHLVQAHRGSITVESAGENQGATFTLSLPSLDTETKLSLNA